MSEQITQKCAYCGQEHPITGMIRGRITFLNGKYVGNRYKKFVDEAENWYCKNKPCHGYDQMAHEG